MTTVRTYASNAVTDVSSPGWNPNSGLAGIAGIEQGHPVTYPGVAGLVLCMSGATSARPQLPASQAGAIFFDTTLGKPVVWDGLIGWRDPATGVMV